jgi:hypothetical protein
MKMKMKRIIIYNFMIDNAHLIQAPQHFFRYVKILLDRSNDYIDFSHDHNRKWMAAQLGITDKTLEKFENGWHAGDWIERANPKSGLPQIRILGEKFKNLYKAEAKKLSHDE